MDKCLAMKPLLDKITRPFLLYVSFVLIISIPVYYIVVDSVWKSELDEHNKIIAEKTAYEINLLNLSKSDLIKSIELWNHIQPGTNIQKITNKNIAKEKIFTIEKQKSYTSDHNIDRFRCLSTVIYLYKQPYLFTVETNIEESQETIAVIAVTTIFFFFVIVIGLLYLNRKLSNTVWEPFKETIVKLKAFNLNHHQAIELPATDTTEFEELNESLHKLIDHSVSVYSTQKEFTENASHELQTPLAILKNKLDILLQDKDLTESQYQIAEEMNKSLTRSSRINKNLLLLAKIENNQFDNSEIQLDQLVNQSIEILQEHFQQKNILLDYHIVENVRANGNIALTEILINNLLINAIRHTAKDGFINIKLTSRYLEVRNSGNNKLDSGLLFKRFSRSSANNNGSGLGLAIIKEICKFQKWEVKYAFENQSHIFLVRF